MFSVHREGFSTSEEYLNYIEGYLESTSRDVQYIRGYHDSCGGGGKLIKAFDLY